MNTFSASRLVNGLLGEVRHTWERISIEKALMNGEPAGGRKELCGVLGVHAWPTGVDNSHTDGHLLFSVDVHQDKKKCAKSDSFHTSMLVSRP